MACNTEGPGAAEIDPGRQVQIDVEHVITPKLPLSMVHCLQEPDSWFDALALQASSLQGICNSKVTHVCTFQDCSDRLMIKPGTFELQAHRITLDSLGWETHNATGPTASGLTVKQHCKHCSLGWFVRVIPSMTRKIVQHSRHTIIRDSRAFTPVLDSLEKCALRKQNE